MKFSVVPLVCVCALGFLVTVQAQDAQDLLRQGNKLFEAKHYKRAIEKYDEALQVSPGLMKALYKRGVSQYRIKDYEPALADLLRVSKSDVDNATRGSALNYAGVIYGKQKKYGEAALTFIEACKSQPRPAFMLNAARAAKFIRDYETASRCVRQVLVADAGNKKAKKLMAQIRSVRTRMRGKDRGGGYPRPRTLEEEAAHQEALCNRPPPQELCNAALRAMSEKQSICEEMRCRTSACKRLREKKINAIYDQFRSMQNDYRGRTCELHMRVFNGVGLFFASMLNRVHHLDDLQQTGGPDDWSNLEQSGAETSKPRRGTLSITNLRLWASQLSVGYRLLLPG